MATIASRIAVKQKKMDAIDAKIAEYKARRDKLNAEIKELEMSAIQQKMTEFNIPFHQIDLFLDSLNPKNTPDPNQINLFQDSTAEAETEAASAESPSEESGDKK